MLIGKTGAMMSNHSIEDFHIQAMGDIVAQVILEMARGYTQGKSHSVSRTLSDALISQELGYQQLR